MPLVSIIMPAYNAGARIGKAMEQVLSQSFSDLELIVVNDGSKDDTEAVASACAAKDPRVRVVTVRNGGPAAARNTGMASAAGKYLTFIDDDDESMPAAFGALAEEADRAGAELVLTGFSIVDRKTGTEMPYRSDAPGVYTRDGIGAQLGTLYVSNLLSQCWAKIFRTDFIRKYGISFSDYRFGEDRLFLFDCLEHAQTVLVSREITYKYYVNTQGSLVNRYYDRKFEACQVLDERINRLADELNARSEANRDIFAYMFIKSAVSCMVTVYSPNCPFDRAGRRAYVREILNNGRVRGNAAVRYRKGAAADVLRAVIRTRAVGLNLFVMKLVTVANKLLPDAFIRIKHRK